MLKELLFACTSVVALVAATPLPEDPRVAARNVVTAAITKINANDAIGLRALFADDPEIIDQVPPFRWTGSNAVVEWLDQSNEFAARDGVQTFAESGTELIGIGNDSVLFEAPFDLSRLKSGSRMHRYRGLWVFVLTSLGDKWKIQEAIWTTTP